MVQEFIEGKHDKDLPMENNPLVDIAADCEGYNCPASPNREDCCHNIGSDGKCHFLINLNELCGTDGELVVKKNNDDLLTQDEVDILADYVTQLQKFAAEDEAQKRG